MNTFSLILMRHGEAGDHAVSDHSRSLTPHGVSQASAAGKNISKIISSCDIAVISDARRTKETSENVLASLQCVKSKFEKKLYSAHAPKDFLGAISPHVTSSDKSVLVIGHNPVISAAASLLTGDFFAFSPADFVVLTIESPDWETAFSSNGCWETRPANNHDSGGDSL